MPKAHQPENLKDPLYTTHNAGRLLQMDPSSVVKWIKDGLLKSYLTPGKHRRIRRSDLLVFLKQQGMYIPKELQPTSRVMLVDEDPKVRTSMTRAMKAHADQVEFLTEASLAVALVQAGQLKVDVLVMEVLAAEMEGLQICQALTHHPDTKHIKIILTTSEPSWPTEAEAKKAGAVALLRKPLTAEQLVSVVLSQNQVRRAS